MFDISRNGTNLVNIKTDAWTMFLLSEVIKSSGRRSLSGISSKIDDFIEQQIQETTDRIFEILEERIDEIAIRKEKLESLIADDERLELEENPIEGKLGPLIFNQDLIAYGIPYWFLDDYHSEIMNLLSEKEGIENVWYYTDDVMLEIELKK